MSEKIIVILLIAAIVLSILSMVLILSFDIIGSSDADSYKKSDSSSASVGLVILETEANKQNG